MIKLYISSPLPPLFGISEEIKSLHMEIPFKKGMTVEGIFDILATQHPRFAEILNDESSSLVTDLVISVNGKLLGELQKRQAPLDDGCDIVFLTPYSGG